ncbi:hypothetical protein Y032_0018g3723 [Ancylostoma ceylanicum]|uniref:Uncharacterized protein n=1 Tax=Ancylostoma ceylanicum TaxID=53326 RepID=A0A016V393_9BILA|nr:hypothetical protein Y032_0018g3723 [Ancylostoma ceylanicum]
MERRCEKNEKIVLQSAAKVFGQVCRIRKALDSIEINAIPISPGVARRDEISRKLFTAALEDVLKLLLEQKRRQC